MTESDTRYIVRQAGKIADWDRSIALKLNDILDKAIRDIEALPTHEAMWPNVHFDRDDYKAALSDLKASPEFVNAIDAVALGYVMDQEMEAV